jgi:hypothetical protein
MVDLSNLAFPSFFLNMELWTAFKQTVLWIGIIFCRIRILLFSFLSDPDTVSDPT